MACGDTLRSRGGGYAEALCLSTAVRQRAKRHDEAEGEEGCLLRQREGGQDPAGLGSPRAPRPGSAGPRLGLGRPVGVWGRSRRGQSGSGRPGGSGRGEQGTTREGHLFGRSCRVSWLLFCTQRRQSPAARCLALPRLALLRSRTAYLSRTLEPHPSVGLGWAP